MFEEFWEEVKATGQEFGNAMGEVAESTGIPEMMRDVANEAVEVGSDIAEAGTEIADIASETLGLKRRK